MRHCFRLAAIALALTFINSATFSQTTTNASGSFTVQGRLTDLNGVAISNGAHSITASVYATGSTNAVYTETDNVTTTDGIFSILLGANGSTKLTLNSNTTYELGISVDGGAQLTPLIQISSVPSALTAHVADTAGFALGITGNAMTTIEGAIEDSLLSNVGSNIVTSVNGLHGNVVLQGGGNLGLTTSGDTIGLTFTGTGGGLTLPFSQTLNSGGNLFSLTNSGSGSAELLANTGTGNALNLSSTARSALSASANGSSPTLDLTNTGGGVGVNILSTMNTAINATTNASTAAALQLKNAGGASASQLIQAMSGSGTVLDLTTQGLTLSAPQTASSTLLQLQNTSATASGNLFAALNSGGTPVFTLSGTGGATLNSSANTALSITGTAGTAISATGSNASGAVLQLQNASTNANAGLISAVNGSGTTAFSVAGSGATSIQSSGSTALNVASSGGTAINATTSAAGSAVLQLQNTASGTGNAVLTAKDATGNTILNVAANGATTITSSASTGLTDSVTTSGNTAARFVGGLSLSGPVGTGTIAASSLSTTISNAYAKANSIIMVTVTSSIAGLNPLAVTSTGAGTFTVSLLSAVPISSAINFNYLIINQ